jgi:hypothetical protein
MHQRNSGVTVRVTRHQIGYQHFAIGRFDGIDTGS